MEHAVKKDAGRLLSETIIYQDSSPTTGDVMPDTFVIRRYTDSVEIEWAVKWCRGGAGDTELLEADYFEHHTMDDFMAFLQSKAWAKDFLNWFDLRNHEGLSKLFRK